MCRHPSLFFPLSVVDSWPHPHGDLPHRCGSHIVDSFSLSSSPFKTQPKSLLGQTVLMSIVSFTDFLKLNFGVMNETTLGVLSQHSLITGGRNQVQVLHRTTFHPFRSPPSPLPLSRPFPNHQALQPSGEWTSLLVTVLAVGEEKSLDHVHEQ